MGDREKLIELQEKWFSCDDCADLEKFAEFLIANGVVVQQWISTKDRLPPVGEEVLCLCDCGYEGIRHYGIGWVLSSDFWYAVTPIGQKPKVLAWMPLPESPEPPKGE